jgi:hypothetical protein
MNSSAFEDIFLCIVDTTLFSAGVFLWDLDLIRAFRPCDFQVAVDAIAFGTEPSNGNLP